VELAVPAAGRTEAPLFRSRYGGLWTDRSDARVILQDRQARGHLTPDEAVLLAHYIEFGYVVLPGAVASPLIDDYLAFFEQAWDDAPPTIVAYHQGSPQRLSRSLYEQVAKVSCLHWYYPRAAELIFPPAVLRFLTLLYERPPVAFQTMTMRKGSEEPLHIDTGPLTLTEPMTMAASWLALEDIETHSGEFEFVPGSHALPEFLHHGTTKGHDGDMAEYGRILNRLYDLCAEEGLGTERFLARRGDVLIWHADLLHGGARIEDPDLTRRSFIAHFMPLGVMPTFYDASGVHEIPYPGGGYCLDDFRVEHRKPTPPATGIDRIKQRIPLGAKVVARREPDRMMAMIKPGAGN
jgi:ectoine hydroxylase-related dioxygenase (phytanoyl-CoA dioxygenase family)